MTLNRTRPATVGELPAWAAENYAPPERIRRFAILDREFSTETGELTPSMKIRRKIVAERYTDVVDALYA